MAFQASSPKTYGPISHEVGLFFRAKLFMANLSLALFTRLLWRGAAGKTGTRKGTCGGSSAERLLSSVFFALMTKAARDDGAGRSASQGVSTHPHAHASTIDPHGHPTLIVSEQLFLAMREEIPEASSGMIRPKLDRL